MQSSHQYNHHISACSSAIRVNESNYFCGRFKQDVYNYCVLHQTIFRTIVYESPTYFSGSLEAYIEDRLGDFVPGSTCPFRLFSGPVQNHPVSRSLCRAREYSVAEMNTNIQLATCNIWCNMLHLQGKSSENVELSLLVAYTARWHYWKCHYG